MQEHKKRKLQGWSKKVEESETDAETRSDLLVSLGKGRPKFITTSLLFAKSALFLGRRRCGITVGHMTARSTVKCWALQYGGSRISVSG